jgi:hypothetical protein
MKLFLNDSFKFSLMRNSIIQFFWWVIFFPGFYSADSFSAVSQAQSGDLKLYGGVSWALYIRFFSLLGNAIPLLTLISGLALTYSVTCLAYSVSRRKIAAVSSILMVSTPVVYAMGITLWHDIPFTAGLILVSAFFVAKLNTRCEFTNRFWILLFPGSVLLTFRPNGLPTLIIFAVIFFLLNKSKKILLELISAITVASVISVGFSYLFFHQPPINSVFAQEFMREDISCYASLEKGKGFVEEYLPGISNSAGWSSPEACTFISKSNLTPDEKVQAVGLLPRVWIQLVLDDPKFVLETHLKRHAYLLPIPLYGIPVEPFIQSNIEFTDREISWAFPEIAEKARVLPRLWNASRGFFGWAGMWFMVLICLALRRTKPELVPLIVMSFSLLLILFIVAPIPDGRYALFVLIAGQLCLIGKTIEIVPALKAKFRINNS